MPRAVTGVKPTADGAWRARYRDHEGKEHAKRFPRQSEAAAWLKAEQAKLQTGTWIDPRTTRTTVGEWCKKWLEGYATRKPSTVRQAEVHLAKVVDAFGSRRLDSLRPSDVKSWTVRPEDPGLRGLVRLRLPRSTGSGARRRRSRRGPRQVPGVTPYVASGGQAAALRGLH